ncbi:MAG: FAD-binding protein, partial [Phycisphaerae bacterium]|nr:FAD-binding protein [Phycisphaerae bacterium]
MPDYDRFLDFLATEDIGDVRRDEPLREHSTLRIGGPAALFVEPRCREHLCLVLRHTANAKIPALVIGDGSNLLFDDAGFRGVVIRIGRHLSAVTIEGTYIRAEAGVWVPRFARAVGRAGLAGLEHVVGIPGTLGGLIVMNGGSQRNNVGEVVRRVWAVDAQGRPHNLS